MLHFTAAFALLLLLLLKVAIPRLYPGLKKHLFLLGFSVFLLAFVTTADPLAHYLVRMMQREPYISHEGISTEPDLELGKQLLIERRQQACHLLDGIMQSRPAEAWETVVRAMTKLAWPRIRPDEAQQILHYLTTTRVPRGRSWRPDTRCSTRAAGSAMSPAEIFARSRTRQEWAAVVRQMFGIAPNLVPASEHVRIVDALVAAQSAAAAPKEPKGASGAPPREAPPIEPERSTALAPGEGRMRVTEYGMSERMGLRTHPREARSGYLEGFRAPQEREFSEQTAQGIDEETARFLEEAHQVVRSIIEQKRGSWNGWRRCFSNVRSSREKS